MTWAPVQLDAGSDLRRLGGVLALDGLLLLVVLLAAHPPQRPATIARLALAPGPGPLRAASLFAGLAPQSPPLDPTDLPGEGPVIALAIRMPEPEPVLKPDPMPLIVSAGDPPEPPELRPELASPVDRAQLASAAIDPALPLPSAERVIADAAPLPADVAPVVSMAPSTSVARRAGSGRGYARGG
jgi:hypothetical protein